MKALSILSAKGGVGKTHLAIELAGAASRAGYRVAILDADDSLPHHGPGRWAAKRTLKDFDILKTDPLQLPSEMQSMNGYDAVIIDSARIFDQRLFLWASDFILIPTCLSENAFGEVWPVVKKCVHTQTKFSIVFNRMSRSKGFEKSTKELASSLQEEFPNKAEDTICPTIIYDNATRQEAYGTGATVFELKPESKAASETEALASFVFRKLALPLSAKD